MICQNDKRCRNLGQSESLTIGALVVARMDSRRFPGKVIRLLKGASLLEWIVTRLNDVPTLRGQVAIATTLRSVDDPIDQIGRELDIPVFRSQFDTDVARRLLDASEFFHWDGFFRINGDSPFVDPDLLSRAIEKWKKQDLDFITNLKPRSFPYGVSCEGIKNSVLRENINQFTDSNREHVTEWFYQNLDKLRFDNIFSEFDYDSSVSLAVDVEKDLHILEKALDGINFPLQKISVSKLYQNLPNLKQTAHAASA